MTKYLFHENHVYFMRHSEWQAKMFARKGKKIQNTWRCASILTTAFIVNNGEWCRIFFINKNVRMKIFGFRKAWTAWYRKYDFIIYFIHWEKNVSPWRKRKTAKNYIWSLRFRSGRFLFIIVGKERKLFMILQTRNVCLQLFIEF